MLLFAVAAPGCTREHSNRDRPTGPLYEMWGASGERIVVERVSDDPTPLAKLRRRHRGFKVYDATFVSVGTVRAFFSESSDEGRTADGASGERRLQSVRFTTYDDGRRKRLVSEGPNVWGVEDGVQVERTARGWAVYDGAGDWTGRLERSGTTWQLVRGKRREQTLRVREEASGRGVALAERLQYRLREGELRSEILLSLALEELGLVERVAVGVWLRSFPHDR